MTPTVFIGGIDAASMGAVVDLKFTRSFGDGQGGGLRDVSFSLDLPAQFQHPALHLFATVDLRHGAESLGEARIVSIDRGSWEIVADGIVRLGEDYECRDDDGAPTSLAVGLPLAISRGLPWVVDPDLTLPTTVSDSMQTITDALNDWAAQGGNSWLVDGRVLRMAADPTTPALMLLATDNPNSSTDGLVTSVTAKYAGAVDEQGNPALIGYVTVEAQDAPKRVERTIDLTGSGAMYETDAAAQATAALVAGTTATLTESVAVSEGALSTATGLDLSGVHCTVREGLMVRQLDWVNPDGSPGLFRDWIVGGVDWSLGDGLVLTPLGANASTLSGAIIDIRRGIADAQGTADDAKTLAHDPLGDLITEDSNSTSGSTMPGAALIGDIWLNSPDAYVCVVPYGSGGTLANWAKVTNPTTLTLIKTHVLAFLTAEGAAGDAASAIIAANGKNQITGASRPPTGSDPGIEGDTWYYYVSGNISAVYVRTSSAWTLRKMRDETIDTLSVGKIAGLDAAFLNAAIDYLTSVDITSATITGGLFRTAVSGARVEISGTTPDKIRFYDALGSVGSIYADSARVSCDASIFGVNGLLASYLTIVGSGTINTGGDLNMGGDLQVDGDAHANRLYSDSLNGGGATSASIGDSGQVIRTPSTRRLKKDIKPLPLEVARKVLKVEAVTFKFRDRKNFGDGVYPGAIAEQVAEDADELWVTKDADGQPAGLRLQEMVPALIAIVRDQQERIERLERGQGERR